jgi:hypothetical protein
MFYAIVSHEPLTSRCALGNYTEEV